MASLRSPSLSVLRHLRSNLARSKCRCSSSSSSFNGSTPPVKLRPKQKDSPAPSSTSSSPHTSNPRNSSPQPPRRAFLRPFILLSLTTLLTIYPALDFFTTYILQIMTVTGPSMSPLLNTDHTHVNSVGGPLDRVLVWMYKPGFDIRRGMVVAFWSPMHPERMVVKRVVGLEGDLVVPRGSVREGERREKSQFNRRRAELERREEEVEGVVVPTGHLWVEGEHPEGDKRSYDSNTYGPVSQSLVVGKVMGVVWPWGKTGRIRWQDWRGTERVKIGAGTVERIEFFTA